MASWNNDRIDADALAQKPPLKFDGKEAVVSPGDRRSGNAGPPLDIASLTEGNVDFIPRVGQYRSSLLGREVVEKIRLKVELRVVSTSLSGSDPSANCARGRPPLPGRLSGRRHHCVHQYEPADWDPIASHHGTEAAHRLRHHHGLSTTLDGIDDQRGVVRKSCPWVRARKINRKGAMTSILEVGAHAAPIRRSYAACTRYQDEIRRDPSSALRPEGSRASS